MEQLLNEANAAVVALIQAATAFARAHLEHTPDEALLRLAACTALAVTVQVQPTLAIRISGRTDGADVHIEVPLEIAHSHLN